MSKHTAGPWSIPREMDSNLFGEAVSIKILDENGFPIAGLDCRPILHNWDEKFPKMGHWAEGADSGKTQIERSVEEMEANAQLIAAAPELLEALEEVTEILDMVLGFDGGYPPEANGPAIKARNAIAKARCEQA